MVGSTSPSGQSSSPPLTDAPAASVEVAVSAHEEVANAVEPRQVAPKCDTVAETFRCLICLEDLPPEAASNALKCSHLVCTDCLRSYWTHCVENDSEPFPKCTLRSCSAHAPYRALSALLPHQVMRRIRQLQALRPARAVDGRAMFCVAPRCLEPLPPPPPLGSVDDDENDTLVTTCPECGQRACLRCGAATHSGIACAQPLASERETRLYEHYAVGRLAACPRCGVHIAREGGCDNMRCARCGCEFSFAPFRSPEEVADANLDLEAGAIDEALEEPQPQPLGASIFLMVWGAGFSGMPTTVLVQMITQGQLSWAAVILLPFVVMGLPTFVCACASFLLYIHEELLPLLGRANALDLGRAGGLFFMALFLGLLAKFLSATFLAATNWVGYVYLSPFVCFSVFLVAFLLCHYLIVAIRILAARRQQWHQIEDNGEPGDDGDDERSSMQGSEERV